jgi:RNA-directed DNA polymerase
MNYAFKNMTKILEYKNIEWNKAQRALGKLQDELVVAYRIKDEEKVKRLQHKIVKSFGARALAVRRVYTNTGSKTPGIDGVIWKSDTDLVKAIYELSNLSNYKAKPMYVMITKLNSVLRG